MDNVSIKYGNGVLNLRKSDTLIGVKPRPGTKTRSLVGLAPQLSEPEGLQTTLGGFQLLQVEQTRGADVEETLDKLRSNNAIAVGTHVFETSNDKVPFVPTGQLYIESVANTSADEVQKLFDKYSLEIIEARDNHGFIVQVTPQSENPIKIAASLQQSPVVAIAEPDLATPSVLKSFILPTDELLEDQWHLQNAGEHYGTTVGFKEGADARVRAAWQFAQTLGDPTVIVAIIDDGFDLRHPDLSGDGKIVAPMDFTRNSHEPLPDLLGGDWHGTACAGIAVGSA